MFALITAILLEGMVIWFTNKLRFSRLQAVIAVFTSYVLMLSVIGFNTIAIITTQTITLSQKTPSFVKDFYHSVVLPLIIKWETML